MSTTGPMVLDPAAPLPSAKLFFELQYTRNGSPTLHHQAGQFYTWNGSCFPVADEASIRAEVYAFLEKAHRPLTRGTTPFQPTTPKVNNVMDALKAATNLDKAFSAPAWLKPTPDHPPEDILACANGLLCLPERRLLPPTPDFWTHNALIYDYDPDAPDPEGWEQFLESLWGHDKESINTLQEVFGYSLTTDTRQQKAFLMVGPKRSGKGTIARVLTGLLGQNNVCAPTLASLSLQFGLAPLIHKPVAIIADARLGRRADQHQIGERLLSVSGEDGQTIDRKYLPPWNGRLPTRFLIMTNELPRFADASGALASRFIILRMTKNFYGREDHGLTGRLLNELPGILNWALDGRERLMTRGYFVQPKSAQEAVQELEDLSSPIGVFLRDRCNVGPLEEVSSDELYQAWVEWCHEQGRSHPGTKQTFARDLHAAIPDLKTTQPRRDGGRIRCYQGVGLARAGTRA